MSVTIITIVYIGTFCISSSSTFYSSTELLGN